jgi:AbrB family looped-hinge helix DNA binding protein
MTIVKLSSKNQIVLPKEARDAMHVKGKDELLVVVKNGIAIIMPKPKSYTSAVSGLGNRIYAKKYLKREQNSW